MTTHLTSGAAKHAVVHEQRQSPRVCPCHKLNCGCTAKQGAAGNRPCHHCAHPRRSLGCRRALQAADLIIATPEKWDGISRNWQNRAYVQKVGLLVIDEIHLLGGDRWPPAPLLTRRFKTDHSAYITPFCEELRANRVVPAP